MTCAAPDCSRASRARGYCDTHYRRVRKWGDPTIVLKPWGTDTFQPNRSRGITMTIDTLARRRLALLAQREDIDAEIKNIDAQLIDAVEVGGHVDIDGQPVWRVQQRRTFSVDRARELAPPEVITAATVETVDPKVLQSMLPPVIREACMTDGKIFVTKAGR